MSDNKTLGEIAKEFGINEAAPHKDAPYNTTDPAAVVLGMPMKVATKNLSAAVSKAIGLPVTLKLSLANRGGKPYIQVTSPDLASKVKVKIFKKLTVIDDGGNVAPDPVDKVLCYFTRLDYRWEHYGGGSNGLGIGVFQLNQEGIIIGQRIDLK